MYVKYIHVKYVTFICQLINEIQLADKYYVAIHIIRHILIIMRSDSV